VDRSPVQHARNGQRLPSDLTEKAWLIFEPLMPAALATRRPRKCGWHKLLNAMMYLLRGGLAWRMPPPGLFPPVSMVQRWFCAWRDNGLWHSINHALVMMVREAEGREAGPSACVIDSQSVKTTESGGPRGYDAGKEVKGRKRHILTDTLGLTVEAVVHTMAGRLSSRRAAPVSRFSPISLPMVPMPEISSPGNSPKSARCRSKSSNARIPPRALSCCRAAGLLSVRRLVEPQPASRQGFREHD